MDAVTQAVIESALSNEDAAKVIAALEDAATKKGVGTVLRNPTTGDVAVLVRQYSETYWRVYAIDDRTWIEPKLVGWDVLHDEAAAGAGDAESGIAVVDPVTDPPTATKTAAKK